MKVFIKYTLIAFVSVVLLTGAFSGGFVAGHFTQFSALDKLPFIGTPLQEPLATPTGANEATPDNLKAIFSPFWETWDLVHRQYVDQPVDDTKLMRGAITGMLAALGDQHTSYMDPSQFTQANTSLSGEYDGIGAWVDSQGDYLTIVSPMPHSPAEKAGLKAGDKVVKVDGVDMTGTPADLVIQKVMGPSGSEVTLTIMRAGEDPFDVKVTRAHIVVPSVESKMLDNNIAYIKLNTFGENSTKELIVAIKELKAQNPKGMILDLRNNGGGYLQTAVEVASQFVKSGVIVSEKYGDGKTDSFDAIPGGLATDIPLVVLVNEGTASASEIVSGAIQDYGRGKLVGVTTYGKGSVQIWTPLSDNQGAVRITIAKWLTPKDRTIHKVGLTPEVVVKMTKEDFDANRDPQLDAAVSTLLEMLK
ncbi:MAG: S41 family peptidase [Chloroflexi bacterium]|nr:S41 family peptidase [Chloroflexota bacterium]